MIIKAVVPVVVSGGVGSVSVPSRNSSSGFTWAYLNGEFIQVGLIPPRLTETQTPIPALAGLG
jgi:hypothetical protein